MILYIGADHRGFELKETLKEFLAESGYTVKDMGNDHPDPDDDYPMFAKLVAEAVQADPYNSKGVLICGSGVGMDIVANRFSQVRSALAISTDQVAASKHDDDTNVLTIAADFTDLETAKRMIGIWSETQFSGEQKDKRRVQATTELGTS